MTITAWGLLALFLAVLLAAAWPLGLWLARLNAGTLPAWMHRVEAPLYRLAGTSPEQPMNWKHYAFSLLAFSTLGVLVVYALQRLQIWLPLNPAGMAAPVLVGRRIPRDAPNMVSSMRKSIWMRRSVSE